MISDTLRNPLSMFEVKGKTALITGASGAFGRGCALMLEVDDDNRPTPTRQRTRDFPAGSR